MPSILELCEKHFKCSCLYQVLGIEKNSSDSEVKKAYYRSSLKVHPDRVEAEDKETATEKFQTLGKVYSILSDPEKRKIYDENGTVDDEDFVKTDRNWEEYWRLLFKKITEEDIIAFEKVYKNSEEESSDIKKFYLEFEGDMDKIMNSVMCATIDDEPRIRDIIQTIIDEGDIPIYKAFTNESKKKREGRKRKAEKEAKLAEKMSKELGLDSSSNGEDSLRALIQKRQESRQEAADDFFRSLEAKYAGKASKKQSKRKHDIDEDEDEISTKQRKRGAGTLRGKNRKKPGK